VTRPTIVFDVSKDGKTWEPWRWVCLRIVAEGDGWRFECVDCDEELVVPGPEREDEAIKLAEANGWKEVNCYSGTGWLCPDCRTTGD
jgi:hypothetical protein